MTRTYSRRATLGVLGAGLAGLTGAVAPRDCLSRSGAGGADCGSELSLSGPDTASLTTDSTDPRFVLSTETDEQVRATNVTWTVYRHENGWERIASDRSSGTSVTLAPDDKTAWAVLVRAENVGYTTSTDLTMSTSTTRYVGPVSLSPGEHAFVLSGRVDGEGFDVVARFTVE